MMGSVFQIVFLCSIIIFVDVFSARNQVVSDIQWIYYNGKTTKDYKNYSLVNLLKVLRETSFRNRKKTTIYIHGYEESMLSNSTKSVVKSYLNFRKDTNIIVLDWSNLSDKGYINNAASNTEMVGRAAGTYLLDAIAAGIPKNSIHIVGYCLGCHVAAALGRRTQFHGVTLMRITGLDCAMTGYFPQVIGMRLSSQSASFVDVVHTDSGRYGIGGKIAHADFWPNGGSRTQPGCDVVSVFQNINANTLKSEFCSHAMSWVFYAESVKYPKNFLAVKCSDNETFNKNFCGEQNAGYMGYGASSLLKGNYYLKTAIKSPFGQGSKGIKGPK